MIYSKLVQNTNEGKSYINTNPLFYVALLNTEVD